MSEDLLRLLKELHSDVVSTVECIEEVEPDGGKAYDTPKTRRLLGLLHQFIQAEEAVRRATGNLQRDVMLT